MKLKQKRSSGRKTTLIIVVVALVVCAGAVLYWRYTYSAKTPATLEQQQQNPAINVPTQPTTTEGQTIQVPTNVDPSSIKNYELITENEEFKIRKLGSQYVITLYPIVNHPDQAAYEDQLRRFKQDALAYLTKNGININTIEITYDPPTAASL